MQTNKLNSDTKFRRIIISISLLLYIAVWTFLFYATYTVSAEEADAAFAFGLLFVSGLFFVVYFVVYLILFSISKDKKDSRRKDYIIALLITFLPILIATVDYAT